LNKLIWGSTSQGVIIAAAVCLKGDTPNTCFLSIGSGLFLTCRYEYAKKYLAGDLSKFLLVKYQMKKNHLKF
jgi:hypothetical protein